DECRRSAGGIADRGVEPIASEGVDGYRQIGGCAGSVDGVPTVVGAKGAGAGIEKSGGEHGFAGGEGGETGVSGDSVKGHVAGGGRRGHGGGEYDTAAEDRRVRRGGERDVAEGGADSRG